MATLQQQMVSTGKVLFSWRSYLPLLLLFLVVPELVRFDYPLGSHRLDEIKDILCLAVSLVGAVMRIATVGFVPKGTSGRNTGSIKASTLNTTGMYSIVRHPLYVANYFIVLGALLFLHSLPLTLIVSLLFWVYYERIMLAEEDFLLTTHGEAFRAWAARTPAVIPAPRQWQSPAMPFCWRTVLRREHSTLLAIAAVFSALEVSCHYAVWGKIQFEVWWVALLSISAALSIAVRVLKKRSRFLHVDGR